MPVGGEAAQTGLHASLPPASSGAPGSSVAMGANAIPLGGDPGNPATSAFAGFTSREDIKKQRELEEARKSGLIPAEKDEEGKDINPHIPQYIAKAPWYLSNDNRPSLKHQRFAAYHEHESSLNNWYKRGVIDTSEPILRYRKGACTNCGAMTHQAKLCTERPRQRGAKWSGRDIQHDELIVADSAELKLDFDGKRDPYGGYDPATYQLVIRDFALADQERKRRKAAELESRTQGKIAKKESTKKRQKSAKDAKDPAAATSVAGSAEDAQSTSDDAESGSSSESEKEDETANEEDDDDVKVKEFDQTNAPVGMKDDRTRTTTMNLRIREDTAKYLFNLDVNSAFYDPKTRSMRDNPLKHCKDSEQVMYRGDNAMRNTAEAECVRTMEIFSWEAYKHNVAVHPQAQPTQLELMQKEFHRKQQSLVSLKKQTLLQKYGGEDYLNPPPSLLFSQSEVYQEYNPVDGSVKKLKERMMAQSRYQDDVLFGDHTAVWGSWYDTATGSWGYRCCRQTTKINPDCSAVQAPGFGGATTA